MLQGFIHSHGHFEMYLLWHSIFHLATVSSDTCRVMVLSTTRSVGQLSRGSNQASVDSPSLFSSFQLFTCCTETEVDGHDSGCALNPAGDFC